MRRKVVLVEKQEVSMFVVPWDGPNAHKFNPQETREISWNICNILEYNYLHNIKYLEKESRGTTSENHISTGKCIHFNKFRIT